MKTISPYEQGRMAAREGKSMSLNPYKDISRLWQWLDGWSDEKDKMKQETVKRHHKC